MTAGIANAAPYRRPKMVTMPGRLVGAIAPSSAIQAAVKA
ncbi:MAG: hypothetical protein JWL70_2567 [Acidimicrobiia bacterium]|nr:hypothetical protein [Acidimicrobiia bacterium]